MSALVTLLFLFISTGHVTRAVARKAPTTTNNVERSEARTSHPQTLLGLVLWMVFIGLWLQGSLNAGVMMKSTVK
jgi:hypothetical protein